MIYPGNVADGGLCAERGRQPALSAQAADFALRRLRGQLGVHVERLAFCRQPLRAGCEGAGVCCPADQVRRADGVDGRGSRRNLEAGPPKVL